MEQSTSVTLKEFNGRVLVPAITFHLPANLSTEEFHSLIPCASSKSSAPAHGFPALQNWLAGLLINLRRQHDEHHPYHKHPYKVHEINIQAVDWFSSTKLGFMKLRAEIETDPYVHEGEQKERSDWLPGAIFLRGGSVAMLIIIQPSDSSGETDKHVIFTIQPRTAACSLAFPEIPAGMLDDNSFKGAAAAELEEEANLTVKEEDLINMSELAVSDDIGSELVQNAVYPSPGACDEFIPIFLCQKRLTRRHMEWLKGKATGLRDEGENITLKLVPLSRAWREGARDGKTLAALALYQGLKGEGKVPDMPSEVEKEPEELTRGG